MTEATAPAGAGTADLPKPYASLVPLLGAPVDGQARPSRDLIAASADLLDLDAAPWARVIPVMLRRSAVARPRRGELLERRGGVREVHMSTVIELDRDFV